MWMNGSNFKNETLFVSFTAIKLEPMVETLDYIILSILACSTPTFLYLDLYLYSAYAAHYVYRIKISWFGRVSGDFEFGNLK